MNITVYCGSNCGNKPIYTDMAKKLGEWIGKNGHTLIYGGGSVGLMGTLADAVMSSGGEAIGVTPNFFIELDQTHNGLSELEVVPSMSARRDRMLELGDAYIAMPGGIGTLDEVSEAIALKKLGFHDKPIIFYNVDGFYDSTRVVMQEMVKNGFLEQDQLDELIFASTPEMVALTL